MKDAERTRRFEAMRNLLPESLAIARQYAAARDRFFTTKADGSAVSAAEEESDARAEHYIAAHFPEDSVITEERKPLLRAASRFSFFQDPLDGSNEVVRSGISLNAASVLQAYADRDEPFAFGVGEVATGRMFVGTTDDGIFLDGAPYSPPARDERFLLWIDHHEHGDVLAGLSGMAELKQAGVAIRLLLYGYLRGGIIVYENPHEAVCFDAAVRTLGGTLAPLRGKTFRFWQVFSMPGEDHAEIMELARRNIWKR